MPHTFLQMRPFTNVDTNLKKIIGSAENEVIVGCRWKGLIVLTQFFYKASI